MATQSQPDGPRASDDSLRHRIHEAYDEVDRTHRSLLLAWVAFAVTFGVLRALTYSIKQGVGPFGDIAVGGVHLHHYVWGIALLMLVGFISLVVDSPRYNPHLGVLYGIACALIIDEYALLLNLRDVYWSEEGRISVDVALGVIAVLGIYVSAASFWRRVTSEVGLSVRPHRRRAPYAVTAGGCRPRAPSRDAARRSAAPPRRLRRR